MITDTVIRGETGAQRLLGYELDVADRKGAVCRLTVLDEHANRSGILHGGFVTTLLDNAMGATASLSVDPTGRRPFVTITMTTQFLAPTPIGAIATARGRITGGGRSTLFVEGELRLDDGTLAATATGVFKAAAGGRP